MSTTNPARPNVTALMRALVGELHAERIPDPLGQPLALWAVWADLCRLADEPVPREVAARLDGETAGRGAGRGGPPRPAPVESVRRRRGGVAGQHQGWHQRAVQRLSTTESPCRFPCYV